MKVPTKKTPIRKTPSFKDVEDTVEEYTKTLLEKWKSLTSLELDFYFIGRMRMIRSSVIKQRKYRTKLSEDQKDKIDAAIELLNDNYLDKGKKWKEKSNKTLK